MDNTNNKYNNSKIYKIISPNTDKIYIGSSIQKYISNRWNVLKKATIH